MCNCNHLSSIVAPSALASDFSQLASECQRVLDDGADWLHMDVMDGHFVPNITMGPPILASVKKALPHIKMDCHMMVANPIQWVEPVAQAGGYQYTFHYEATDDHMGVVREIKKHGMRAAIALNPSTPANSLSDDLIKQLDMVLVMTVWPGKGGQKFMQDQMPKLNELRYKYTHLDLQVDGGVGPATIDECTRNGANVAVAGTAVFGAQNVKQAIDAIRMSINAQINK
ncbi:hypothetical protein E3P86_03289 [Wallemia ichthyophaga]|uniref:Ribulose-phosphate 3-epimerase n=1 Tax=Wallemia ichthyophaga TaxID=245174 RepID=A0A4T0IWF5_WALIC|nr:hypothetical protein E3P86_03289 [Wallemia ichthyophaga]